MRSVSIPDAPAQAPLAGRVQARQRDTQAEPLELPRPLARRRRGEVLVVQNRPRFIRDPLAAWLLSPGDEPPADSPMTPPTLDPR